MLFLNYVTKKEKGNKNENKNWFCK
jgi:hypothetical protein